MSEQAIIATAEKLVARMGAVFVPHSEQQPFRAQLVNMENQTAAWFGFDTEDEAQSFALALTKAVSGRSISAVVGTYPADAHCPRKKQ